METDSITTIVDNARSYLTSVSIDTIIVAGLSAIVFLYGTRAGKYNLISLILSTYIALILFTYFPYFEYLKWDFGTFLQKFDITKALMLLIVIGIVHKFLAQITESDFEENDKKLSDIIILSASFAITLLSVFYITEIVTVSGASAFLDNIFTNQLYLFWTLVIPIIGIFITTRR